jgi:hypothetical protein
MPRAFVRMFGQSPQVNRRNARDKTALMILNEHQAKASFANAH